MKWYRKTWKSFLINPIFAFEHVIMSSLVAQTVKNLPAIWETQVWSVDWEDALEKGMATHSSVLAWRIPWTEEPGGPQSVGSQRVAHDWAANTHSCLHNVDQSLPIDWKVEAPQLQISGFWNMEIPFILAWKFKKCCWNHSMSWVYKYTHWKFVWEWRSQLSL